MSVNFLAALPQPGPNWADLPPHVYDESGVCAFCGDAPTQRTYANVVEHFYEFEYEGERYHTPEPEDVWQYVQSTCLATAY